MTLCKYRPQRTYDAQFIFEHNDVRGLMKKLQEEANRGDTLTPYYIGASIALETMFRMAQGRGEVDMWTDFLEGFRQALDSWEGEQCQSQ